MKGDTNEMGSNTYAAVGNKLDMSDIITNISPDETPLYSKISRTRATATNHEWLEDSLGEPIVNKKPEGFTYTTQTVSPRVRLNNYTQIMYRGIEVTQTQEVVLKYGLTKETAYQMRKTLKEIAFDCEKALITQDTKIPGTASDMTRQFGGLPYWVVTNRFENNGTARDLTFDLINTALEQTWKVGGKPSMLLISPRSKRIISTFTAGNTKYMEGNETRKLTQMIAVIETDFGTLQCLVDRFMPDDKIYGLSPEYMRKAILRPFKTGDIPEMSDNYMKYVKGEWTLEMRAEKAHFMIGDLNGIVPATA